MALTTSLAEQMASLIKAIKADVRSVRLATAIAFSPAGGIVATNVQAALVELDTKKAGIASPTFAGAVTLSGASAGLELGSLTVANTPYVDFHSSGSANDYDARIIANYGAASVTGGGQLEYGAGNHIFQSNLGSSPGIRIFKNTASDVEYARGHLELFTSDGSDASLGFHRGGFTACQLRHSADGLILSSTSRVGSATFTATGAVVQNSDERLKEGWEALSADFVARLAEVKHGTYKRIGEVGSHVGVSAQSLQKLMPEAVIPMSSEEGATLSVAYGSAALVSAVQLAAAIVEMRQIVEGLLVEIEKLKAAA